MQCRPDKLKIQSWELGQETLGGHFRILPTTQAKWFLSQLLKYASCCEKAARENI